VLALVAGTLAQAATPTLVLETRTPLVVRGVGFAPGERVTVTALTLAGPRRVLVRASATGRFRARLPGGQACGQALAVRARGERGSVATLRLVARPCVPPPID
jgi:hypothetical protein